MFSINVSFIRQHKHHCLVVKFTPANQRPPFSILPSSISTCDQQIFGVMLRHTLISNPLLSRATTKHICFDFSVSKMVRPVYFQSYSLFKCAGGAGVCGRRPVIIFRCLVETGRTTRSGCRGACRKNGRE